MMDTNEIRQPLPIRLGKLYDMDEVKQLAFWAAQRAFQLHRDGAPAIRKHVLDENIELNADDAFGKPNPYAIEACRYEWSRFKFPNATALSSLSHLKREVKEIQESLEAGAPDLKEYGDAQVLLWDSLQRAGFTLEELFTECRRKFEENKTRKWKELEDGSHQHIDE